MKSTEEIATEVLRQSLASDQDMLIIGNVTAGELARLAATAITSCCPRCGAEPWCNIDCMVCTICHGFEATR